MLNCVTSVQHKKVEIEVQHYNFGAGPSVRASGFGSRRWWGLGIPVCFREMPHSSVWQIRDPAFSMGIFPDQSCSTRISSWEDVLAPDGDQLKHVSEEVLFSLQRDTNVANVIEAYHTCQDHSSGKTDIELSPSFHAILQY